MNLTKAIAIARALGGSSGSGGGGSGGGGGGSVAVSPKEVNFYDYDGTCVHAYTVAEAQKLTELPAGPEHPGLVFQGWNWSLENVKSLTRAMNIGAMYTTDDGTTRLYITLHEGRTSPMLGVGVNGTVTVDWGDGTEPDVLTGKHTGAILWTPNHAYAKPGDYVIRLTVDGEILLAGNSGLGQGPYVLRHSSGTDGRHAVYYSSINKVELGNGVTSIGQNAFCNCYSLASITIPDSVTSIGTYSFYGCYSLAPITIPDSVTSIPNYSFYGCYSFASITIPDGVTSIGQNAFNSCFSLASITIPDSVTSIRNYAFNNNYALTSITIPDSVTSIGQNAFYNCYSLASIIIPDGVTSIANYAFNSNYTLTSITIPDSVTSIGNHVFVNCYSLASIIIPDGVTSIASYAFSGCGGMCYYDFTTHTSVPALGDAKVFNDIPADCEIRVPAALYDEWISATNWSTYANYIKAY